MTALPIPFVVAFMLVLLLASNYRKLNETPTGRVFALILCLNALSMILVGFRWSWDLVRVLPIVATLSVVGSALLYLAFCSLGRRGPVVSPSRDWPHGVLVLLVAANALLLPRWTDISLIASKLFYAMALAQLARRTPDSLQLVRLGWLKNSQHALWGAAALLLFSVALDIAIAIDFARYDGRHAESLVGFASLVVLVLLGCVSVLAARGRANESATDFQTTESDTAAPTHTTQAAAATTAAADADADADDHSLLQELNRLLIDDRLYADTELNLQRLARKAGVPARAVSRAINAQTGQNVSQWVNSARIDAVCAQLECGRTTVGEAMLAAGFVTKSNFNREFRRLKGCSPSEWRSRQETHNFD